MIFYKKYTEGVSNANNCSGLENSLKIELETVCIWVQIYLAVITMCLHIGRNDFKRESLIKQKGKFNNENNEKVNMFAYLNI